MKLPSFPILLALCMRMPIHADAFSYSRTNINSAGRSSTQTQLGMTCNNNNDNDDDDDKSKNSSRRIFLNRAMHTSTSIITSTAILSSSASNANAVERAVGAAEKSCREAGNCLENFDLDGAVGWNWGGKDRCDATDPRCGPDGQLRDAPPTGDPVPQPLDKDGNELKITNTYDIEIIIGKAERGTLSIGLYGEACPSSVSQLVDFLTTGIVTTSKLMLEDGYGVSTTPVSLQNSGTLNVIYPNSRLDFGIISQGKSYAKKERLNKVPDDFVPQPKPNSELIVKESSNRLHNVSGLISIPKSGIGYGGSTFENDDEAYGSAFQITANKNGVSSMDKEGRKVIGQLMDESSMQLLSRLASLPTKKGLKGVIPGQNAGPPLLITKVVSITSTST